MIKKIGNSITIILFLLAVSLPLVGCLLQWQITSDEQIRAVELRDPTAFPTAALFHQSREKYFQRFEAWFSDHFGFRKLLVFYNSYIKVFVFKTSSSREVILGRDKWLFFANKQSRIYYRHTSLFDPADLLAWKTTLEKRRNWLAAKGIHFIFVIAPSKESIYPEFISSRYNQVQPTSRMDQLVQYMRQNSTVEVVDLRSALLAEKANRDLYLHGDTHWNQYGAFIGYQEIAKRLSAINPQIKPLTLADYSMHNVMHRPDLPGLLGLPDFYDEPNSVFALLSGERAHVVEVGISPPGMPPSGQSFVTTMKNPALPSAVVFRDSFGAALAPLLAQHFKRAVFLWQDDFDASIVKKEKPDVVIQELVERQLMKPPSMLSRDIVNAYPVADLGTVGWDSP